MGFFALSYYGKAANASDPNPTAFKPKQRHSPSGKAMRAG